MYTIGVNSLTPDIQCGYLPQNHPEHGHLCWELHLFTQGRGWFRQDGLEHAIGELTLFFSPPGHAHSIQVGAAQSFYYIQFAADTPAESFLAELHRRQTAGKALRVATAQVAELERIKRKADHSNQSLRESARHHFLAWLYELGQDDADQRPGDRLEKAVAFMRQRVERRLSLDEVAAAAGMDRYHFSRQFKARYGQAPMAWFMGAKLEAATFLLGSADLGLADIAQRLGFADEFHFSKMFRARIGMPPGHWRRMRG